MELLEHMALFNNTLEFEKSLRHRVICKIEFLNERLTF